MPPLQFKKLKQNSMPTLNGLLRPKKDKKPEKKPVQCPPCVFLLHSHDQRAISLPANVMIKIVINHWSKPARCVITMTMWKTLMIMIHDDS